MLLALDVGHSSDLSLNMSATLSLLTLHWAVQVHYDVWRHPADTQSRSTNANSSLAERLLPQSLQDAYADGRANLAARISAAVSL